MVALRSLLEKVEAAQVENAYVAGWPWTRVAKILEVSRQAVHKKHAKRLRAKFSGEGSGDGGAGRSSIVLLSARSCVESAVEEARSLGHDSVGDEDLLLGILVAGDGDTLEALLSLR